VSVHFQFLFFVLIFNETVDFVSTSRGPTARGELQIARRFRRQVLHAHITERVHPNSPNDQVIDSRRGWDNIERFVRSFQMNSRATDWENVHPVSHELRLHRRGNIVRPLFGIRVPGTNR
jgi:hypothetical protein